MNKEIAEAKTNRDKYAKKIIILNVIVVVKMNIYLPLNALNLYEYDHCGKLECI